MFLRLMACMDHRRISWMWYAGHALKILNFNQAAAAWATVHLKSAAMFHPPQCNTAQWRPWKGKAGKNSWLSVGRHLASMESKGCQNVGVSNINDWETLTLYYIPCLFYAISVPTQVESARHSQSRKLKEICGRLPVPDLCFVDLTWLLCHHCCPLQLAQVSLGWAKRRTVAATMATDTVEPQKTGAIFCPQLQVKSSNCSRQEANNTSNLERVLQCSHTLGVFKQNDTNIFLFQHTMCQRAPRQLMKWDLAHFLWSWKARAGQHWNICKILQVHHGTTGLRRLLFGKWFFLELCASGSSQEPEFSVPDCLHEIPRCLFQYHFSIISVTYGRALHQTSTICKLTQLQLRIHRDLLQCFPFDHPHNFFFFCELRSLG